LTEKLSLDMGQFHRSEFLVKEESGLSQSHEDIEILEAKLVQSLFD
jgi:hypothetical protein